MVLGDLGFRANRSTRARQRTTNVSQRGEPRCAPPPTSTPHEMRAHAFLRARKTLRFLYLRGTEASLKRYATD